MKRALLTGVDEYSNFSKLSGCINDVNAVMPLLARNYDGSPAFDCEARTGAVGRDQLIGDLEALLSGGADVALFYFAGHGHDRGNDVVLVTHDGTEQTPGISMSEILGMASDSPVGEIILLLDCCFSGAAGAIPQLGTADAVLRSGLTILAASRGDQPAAETAEARGAFSTFLCGALEGGAADVVGKVTVAGIYSYLDESFGPWDQRPVFKANLERLHELRATMPAVPLPELRLLSSLFPAREHEFPLDPSYEPEADPQDEDHEKTFAILQKYRAAKLLEPIGEEHMYFAAMNGTGCKLTPLGEHYRHVVAEDLL